MGFCVRCGKQLKKATEVLASDLVLEAWIHADKNKMVKAVELFSTLPIGRSKALEKLQFALKSWDQFYAKDKRSVLSFNPMKDVLSLVRGTEKKVGLNPSGKRLPLPSGLPEVPPAPGKVRKDLASEILLEAWKTNDKRKVLQAEKVFDTYPNAPRSSVIKRLFLYVSHYWEKQYSLEKRYQAIGNNFLKFYKEVRDLELSLGMEPLVRNIDLGYMPLKPTESNKTVNPVTPVQPTAPKPAPAFSDAILARVEKLNTMLQKTPVSLIRTWGEKVRAIGIFTSNSSVFLKNNQGLSDRLGDFKGMPDTVPEFLTALEHLIKNPPFKIEKVDCYVDTVDEWVDLNFNIHGKFDPKGMNPKEFAKEVWEENYDEMRKAYEVVKGKQVKTDESGSSRRQVIRLVPGFPRSFSEFEEVNVSSTKIELSLSERDTFYSYADEDDDEDDWGNDDD